MLTAGDVDSLSGVCQRQGEIKAVPINGELNVHFLPNGREDFVGVDSTA